MVKKHTKCKIIYTEQRFQDNRHYHVSAEKAKKDKVISVNPHQDVNFGIEEVAKLLQSGRIKDIESDMYSNIKHIAKNKV